MTITEGGYSLADGNPTIEKIVSGLDARRVAGGNPITVLSCDNLRDNGAAARDAIATVASVRSVELYHIDWEDLLSGAAHGPPHSRTQLLCDVPVVGEWSLRAMRV